MIKSSTFISKVAPILEEQDIFIKKIIFETFEYSNEIKIIIEGARKKMFRNRKL